MAVFRVEKTRDYTVMSNHHLRNKTLSLKAKGLMSLMLSLPEDWDYTTKGLAYICKDGVDAICATVKELERRGYLTRQRVRDERGRLGDIEYTIHEQPTSVETPDQEAVSPKRENPVLEKPMLEKPKQVNPEQVKPEQENPRQLNTNKSSNQEILTDGSNNHQSIYPPSRKDSQNEDMDKMDAIDVYRQIILDNVEYDILVDRYGKERMDEVVELILETVCSNRRSFRIAADEFPSAVVKSRMMKINSSHVEYVFDCLDKNTTKVRNIKAYLLTALYNAPATIDSYYRAEVNHDLYGG